MIEKMVPLDLPPGLFHNGTKLEAKGRWYDGHLVRWHEGALQPVGGWDRLSEAGVGDVAALSGTPANIMILNAANGQDWVIAGTSAGLFAWRDGGGSASWTDITPAGWSGVYNWDLEQFGNILVAQSNQRLYTWDLNTANDAVVVAGAPTDITGGMCVTPERFIFVLGSSVLAGDPFTVIWPDQESTSVWTPAATNQAGSQPLKSSSFLECGRRLRDQTLIWSHSDLWSARYIGGQFIYSFRQEGENCGVCGFMSPVIVDNRAFWMSETGQFFMYDGWVRSIPCDVADKFLGEFSVASGQSVKGWANPHFNEVWWFYPTSSTNNRYIKYNYVTGIWDYGTLGRDAACGGILGNNPVLLAVDGSGFVYKHEDGNDRGSEVPYVESGPFEIGEGDNVMRIQRLVPDEKTLGDTKMTVYTSFDPTTTETSNGPYTLTQPTDVRLTARQIRVKIEQNVETNWRVGKPRLGVIPMGRR